MARPEGPKHEAPPHTSSQATTATHKTTLAKFSTDLSPEPVAKMPKAPKTQETTVACCPQNKAREALSDAARQAVLQCAELVENIVSFLPPKNIFGVLRVSKSFHATKESPAIKKKVFLQINSDPKTVWVNPSGNMHLVPVTPSPFLDTSSSSIMHKTATAPKVWRTELRLGLANNPLPPEEQKEQVSISLESSVLDTHISDPPLSTNGLRTRISFKVGNHTVSTVGCFDFKNMCSTGREVVEQAKTLDLALRLKNFTSVPSRGREATLGQYIAELEKETGCRAMVNITPRWSICYPTTLAIQLPDIGLPENLDWETNGKALWDKWTQVN